MTRQITIFLIGLWAGSLSGQDMVVNTRLQSFQTIRAGENVQLDLTQYFQTYASPGPVATFTLSMPVPDGRKTFTIGGQEVELMTYKLRSGESYADPYAVEASQFEWTEHTIAFQLLASEAPVSVANFMTYSQDGVYQNTIVHRNESTGVVFRPGGAGTFVPLPIVQAGGFRLYEDDQYLLEWIPTREAIPFEETRNNTAGTLALARTASLDSATSQFFINLQDNSNAFGSAYAVMGELVNPEQDLPVLATFADVPVYDLSSPQMNGLPNVFSTLPFGSIPLYSPIWNDKDSYARFTAVTVAEGGKDGIAYSWEFADLDEEGVDEEEAAHRASFDIQINGTELVVNRLDSGFVRVVVTGTFQGTTASFNVDVIGYNPDALDLFPSSTIRQGGWLENSWFGWIAAEDFPLIYHANHGALQISDVSTPTVLTFYDYALESWQYTTSALYPYLFSYRLNAWLYYLEESAFGGRWFYYYDGANPRWVLETDL